MNFLEGGDFSAWSEEGALWKRQVPFGGGPLALTFRPWDVPVCRDLGVLFSPPARPVCPSHTLRCWSSAVFLSPRTERDASNWSTDKLKTLFLAVRVQNEEGKCEVTEVSKLDGEASINNRKGKLIFFYEWSIKLNWTGESRPGQQERGPRRPDAEGLETARSWRQLLLLRALRTAVTGTGVFPPHGTGPRGCPLWVSLVPTGAVTLDPGAWVCVGTADQLYLFGLFLNVSSRKLTGPHCAEEVY